MQDSSSSGAVPQTALMPLGTRRHSSGPLNSAAYFARNDERNIA